MSSNFNLPPLKVFIRDHFLFDCDFTKTGKTEGHLVSVRARQNQALQFSVLLNNGALFTGLPAHSISFNVDSTDQMLKLEQAQMWDCISDSIEVFTIESLRYAECFIVTNKMNTNKHGKYLFTIDFIGEGYSRHPTHWKQLHAIETNDGYFMLYPQYRIRFQDEALFEQKEELPKYIANTKHWIVGS